MQRMFGSQTNLHIYQVAILSLNFLFFFFVGLDNCWRKGNIISFFICIANYVFVNPALAAKRAVAPHEKEVAKQSTCFMRRYHSFRNHSRNVNVPFNSSAGWLSFMFMFISTWMYVIYNSNFDKMVVKNCFYYRIFYVWFISRNWKHHNYLDPDGQRAVSFFFLICM